MQEPSGEVERRRRVIERARELEHEHTRQRRRLSESTWLRILSLRLLRQMLGGLFRPPRRSPPRSVPRPEAGRIAVSFVGHASVMLTTAKTRMVVDPFLPDWLLGMRRREAACLHGEDIADTEILLISHPHPDRLHRASLRRFPAHCTLLVPPRCADLVADLGFARIVELAPGQRHIAAGVEVTAVAARHDARRGLFSPSWRGAIGFMIKAEGATLYAAGDTGYFSGFEELGRRLHPDLALLPIAAYEPPVQRSQHMSPVDALQAFHDLGASLMLPVAYGSFPLGYEPMAEPLTWLLRLAAEQGMSDRIAVLRPGESLQVLGRA